MTMHPLSALDVAFLCLESAATPMHVGALITLAPGEPVCAAELAGLIAQRAAAVVELTRRVQSPGFLAGGMEWGNDPGFDPGQHVYTHGLPSPGGREQLLTRIADLMAEQLDTDRPLWEAHVIMGSTGGTVSVLLKLHHSLADGASAALLGFRLLDQGALPTPPSGVAELPHRANLGESATWQQLGRWLLAGTRTAAEVATKAMADLPTTVGKSRETAAIAAAVARGIRLRPGTNGLPAAASSKRAVATASLSLDDVARARARHRGTLNDILLATMTGAFREWLGGRGDLAPDAVIRALIPVNIRPRATEIAGGNKLSGYLCDLPVGERDPRVQASRVRAQMESNKAAGPLAGPGAIPVLADRLPAALHRLATPIAGRAASLLFDTVITNVPLLIGPLTLDGAPLTGIHPILPLAPGQSLTVAMVSYDDHVHVGLYADRRVITDLEVLADAIPAALQALIARDTLSLVPSPRKPASQRTELTT
jgi:diacylglycerol O-acyltransferase